MIIFLCIDHSYQQRVVHYKKIIELTNIKAKKAMELHEVLKKNQPAFHKIVAFDPLVDKLLPLNFTSENKEITSDILKDTQIFNNYINEIRYKNNARYGIGGYGEHRTIYKVSKVFDGATASEEPRRLHLGTDIWGQPNTVIMAPLDGVVHSFAFNNDFGDYGATIILAHQLESMNFFSLYGHLSLNSLTNLKEGQHIKKGENFCEFGLPFENGHWPPHLHFQIINDIGTYKGDYPGVCKFSERKGWLENSPDPDLILQMNQYC